VIDAIIAVAFCDHMSSSVIIAVIFCDHSCHRCDQSCDNLHVGLMGTTTSLLSHVIIPAPVTADAAAHAFFFLALFARTLLKYFTSRTHAFEALRRLRRRRGTAVFALLHIDNRGKFTRIIIIKKGLNFVMYACMSSQTSVYTCLRLSVTSVCSSASLDLLWAVRN